MFSFQHFNQDIFNQQQQQDFNRANSNSTADIPNSTVSSQKKGDIYNNNNNNIMTSNASSKLASLNHYNQRKSSIFDNTTLMTSPTTNPSDLFSNGPNSSSSPNNNTIEPNSDPFELNTSIWNNNGNQQQQQQQFQATQHPSHLSVSAASSNGVPPPQQSSYQRRASYNDYYPNLNNNHHQNRFNSNYTIWSNNNNNNMIDDYTNSAMWQQQQQMAAVAAAQQAKYGGNDSGFLLSPRRHSYTPNSLDSPIFTPSSTFDHISEEPSNNNTNNLITESTPSFISAYKSVDSYFTNDQYNRVTIKDYSVSEMTSMLENLVQKGAQLPRFSGNSLPSTQLVLIAFKAGRVDVFYLPDSSPLRLKLHDLVVVEADRGRDLGKIVKLDVSIDEARLLKYLQHQEQQAALASFDNPGSTGSIGSLTSSPPPPSSVNGTQQIPTLHFPKPIVRFAYPTEVYQISNKLNDEEKAKKICCLKIESSSLKMFIIDAEYQWDRRKLTFYYNALHRIDFRDLVRELFRIYKTRIWMCAVGKDVNGGQQNNGDGDNLGEIWENKDEASTGDSNMFIPRQFSSPDQSIWN